MATNSIIKEDPSLSPLHHSRAVVRPRLDSVDLLRGSIMALMLLDHTRDFIMNPGISPTNMATTTPALFFTRWITHFCAPTFMLLAGVGAYLSQARGKTTGQISWFLLTRGLWLIVLELTVSRWGLTFNLHYGGFAWLLVLWSLGCAMICLAGLVHLPRWAIGAICFASSATMHSTECAPRTSAIWDRRGLSYTNRLLSQCSVGCCLTDIR